MRLSLIRLATVRLRHQWPMALAQGLGLAAALALALTVPLVQSTASEAALRQVLQALDSKAYVQLEQFGLGDPAAWDSFQQQTASQFSAKLDHYFLPGAHYGALGRVTPWTINGQDVRGSGNTPISDVAFYENLAAHVTAVEGAAPQDGLDGSAFLSTMSDTGAKDYGFHVGDVICFLYGPPPQPRYVPISWCTKLAGTWKAHDPHEAFWGGYTPDHTLLLGRDSYFGVVKMLPSRSVNPRAGQFYGPKLGAIDAQNVGDLIDRVNQERGYFGIQHEGLFSTGIDTGLKDYLQRAQVAAFTIQLVAAALLVIAAYSVAFLAGHFLDSQAPLLGVLRGRGWPRIKVWRLLMTQYLLLGVLAVPAGLVVAFGVSALLGRAYLGADAQGVSAADLPSLLPFALITLAGLSALIGGVAFAAARRGVLEIRRGLSRPPARPWYRWRNLDLGLALLAVPMLAEVRFQGNGGVRAAAAGSDPTALVLPAIALALLALASLRLMPLAAAIAGRAARGVAGDLASWQFSRRPSQHARLAMLVSFTVAVGLFSSVYASTEQRNTIDRADYEAGADLRAVFQGFNQEPPNVDRAVDQIGGVAEASKAFRGTGSPGRSNIDATVLGVDPPTFLNVAWTRGDLSADPIPVLTQRLLTNDPDGIAIQRPASAMRMWVWSPKLDGELLLNLTDAHGLSCTCSFGTLAFTGEQVLTAPLTFAHPPAYPLRLRGMTLVATGGPNVTGDFSFGDLAAVGPDGTATTLEPFSAPAQWWHMSQGPVSDTADLLVNNAHPRAGGPTATATANLARGTLLIRPAPSDKPIPALVARPTLEKLGVKLNQAFPMHVDTAVVEVTAVGTVDYFPTLYPGVEDFLVLPRDTLLGRLGHEHYSLAWPNEAWLRVDGGSTARIESTLRKDPALLDVVNRSRVQQAALSNPLRLALQATLLIGFVAALGMAMIGFGLHFLLATRSRLSEYAILQANGLSPSTVRRSLMVEQLVLLFFSVLIGGVIAFVLSWAILPAVQIGTSISDIVPPTVLTIDPLTASGVVLLVAAFGVLAGFLISRFGSRFDLVEELRLLG